MHTSDRFPISEREREKNEERKEENKREKNKISH